MSSSETDLNHNQVRVGDERLGVIHSGSRYTLGFGRDYYGIWDDGGQAGPAQRFPASAPGREAAWQRYVELEPSAEDARAAQAEDEDVEEAKRGWTRGRLITVGIIGAVIVLAVVLTQINKSGPSGGGGGGATTGNTAHIEATGGATVTEDLTQQSFKFTGFGTLYPKIETTWKGPNVTMHLILNVPNVGTNTTNQNPFRVMDFTLQTTAASSSPGSSSSPASSPSGGAATAATKFLSNQGECQINLKTLEEDGIDGTFTCTGVPSLASSTTTIDIKGNFSAKT